MRRCIYSIDVSKPTSATTSSSLSEACQNLLSAATPQLGGRQGWSSCIQHLIGHSIQHSIQPSAHHSNKYSIDHSTFDVTFDETFDGTFDGTCILTQSSWLWRSKAQDVVDRLTAKSLADTFADAALCTPTYTSANIYVDMCVGWCVDKV